MPSFDPDSTALPVLQARTHCTLVARDPHFIYAYWDYTNDDLERARKKLKHQGKDARLVLRIYDVTLVDFNGSNANYTWEVDVGFTDKSRYIQVWQDNATYCACLGLSGVKRFVPLRRSNIAHTPSATPSRRNDMIWQNIKFPSQSRPFIREHKKTDLAPGHRSLSAMPAGQTGKSRTYHLTDRDIRAYYMRLFSGKSRKASVPSMEDILKRKLKGRSLEKTGLFVAGPESIEQIHPGASEAVGSVGKKAAGETSPAFQAEGSEARLNKRQFFFEAWTELIVHGRTEPDARLWVNQKEVPLNPDGTFSLRYALPDGEVPLKLTARSADGVEERHIHTGVERKRTISTPGVGTV